MMASELTPVLPTHIDLAQISSQSRIGYAAVAQEYYSPNLHPTCANFRALTPLVFEALDGQRTSNGKYIEIGCGIGCLDDFAGANRTVLTDVTPEMLALAENRTRGTVRCELMDAFAPSDTMGTFAGAAAFLADSYNHEKFYRGVKNLIEPNVGRLIETHPTYAFKALLGVERYEQFGLTRTRVDPRRNLRPKKKAGFGQRIELLKQLCRYLEMSVTQTMRDKWQSRIDWVDATICAFIAYLHSLAVPGLLSVGHPGEGSIYLYVPRTPFSVTG